MTDNLKSFRVFSYREQVARSLAWGHHFLFLNILLSIIIGGVYVYAAPDTGSFLSFFYLIITWLGQMSFLACLTYLIILFPLSFIGRYHAYKALAVILAVASMAVLLTDAKLFLAARVHLSIPVLRLMLGDFDFNTGLNYNFLLIAVPLVCVLELVFSRLSSRELYRRRLRNNHFPALAVAALTASFIASHCIHIWADATSYEAINTLRPVFPAHYPMTAKSFLSSHGFIKNDALPGTGGSGIALRYPLERLEIEPEPAQASIVAVFINGLSYDDLSAELTPGLLRLRSEAQSFDNYYLPYAGLAENEFASTYGLPVQYRGAFREQRIAPAVIDELHRQEYLVRVISDSAGSDSVSFDGYRSVNIDRAGTKERIFERACEYIDALPGQRRFSLSLIVNALLEPGLQEPERERILREIDARLPALLEALARSRRLDTTLVAVTSLLGNDRLSDGSAVYNRPSRHVPLILRWPGGARRGQTVQELASPFDLTATIGAQILGIKNSGGVYSVGADLLSLPRRDFFISNNSGELLLIADKTVTVYRNNGESFVESGGQRLQVRPNLENLIRAMRDLNRFKD